MSDEVKRALKAAAKICVSDEVQRALKAVAKICFDYAALTRADIEKDKILLGARYDHDSYGVGYDEGSLRVAELLGDRINTLALHWPNEPPS